MEIFSLFPLFSFCQEGHLQSRSSKKHKDQKVLSTFQLIWQYFFMVEFKNNAKELFFSLLTESENSASCQFFGSPYQPLFFLFLNFYFILFNFINFQFFYFILFINLSVKQRCSTGVCQSPYPVGSRLKIMKRNGNWRRQKTASEWRGIEVVRIENNQIQGGVMKQCPSYHHFLSVLFL